MATAQKFPGAPFLVFIWQVLCAGVRDTFHGELQVRAASLVYSTLLALVPLIAVSFSVLKGFGVQGQLHGIISKLFSSVGDDQEAIVNQIVGFVDNMEVGVLGGLGLAILFYTVFSLIRKIETAINHCWRTYQSRSFGEGFTRYISIIIMGPVVLFAAMTMSASITNEPLYQSLSRVPGLAELIDWGGQLLPYGMLVMAFTAIYYFLPNTYVRLRAALTGGVIAALLWFVFSMFFAQIVAGSSNYVAIYATFATMIIFMIWMFLAWLLLLFGASIAFYAQNPSFTRLAPDEEPAEISGQARERVALAVMRQIARNYAQGNEAPSIAVLSEELNIPLQSVSWVVSIMSESRLLTATTDSPSTFVPGRAPQTIAVKDVLHTIRRAGHDARKDTDGPTSESEVALIVTTLEHSQNEALGGMTLHDLATDAPTPNLNPD